MNNHDETLNGQGQVYLDYLLSICPDLDEGVKNRVNDEIDQTDWEAPSCARDFNNIAVVSLLEAEACEELELKGLYVETAINALSEALNSEVNLLSFIPLYSDWPAPTGA